MDTLLNSVDGFQWDEGNRQKSLQKHGVTHLEVEETFFHFNLLSSDIVHSKNESRFLLLGKTNDKHILFIVFTVRLNKIRVISARIANKKERTIYEQAIKENS